MVKEALEKIVGYEGYNVYIRPDGDYFWVVTPRNNVLCIERSCWFGGLRISLEYVPSRKTGSGCSCIDDDMTYDISEERLVEYEDAGLKFARELKAKLYSKPEDFFNEWFHKEAFKVHKDNIEEVEKRWN